MMKIETGSVAFLNKIKGHLSLLTLTFLAILCLLYPHKAYAGWNQVSSPTSQNLNGVWFADSTTGVCVGDNGAVARTNDGITFLDHSISGGTNLNGVHFAPDVALVPAYENLLTYTEVDPISQLTVNRYDYSASTLNQTLGDDTFLYQDFGSGYFNDDVGFEHQFEFIVSPGGIRDVNWVCPWVVSDVVANYLGLNSGYSFCPFETPSGRVDLELYNNTTGNFHSFWGNMVPGVTYYARAIVDTATAQVLIYDDPGHNNLIDSLSVPSNGAGSTTPSLDPADRSYRYMMAFTVDTQYDGNWNSLYAGDFDLMEPNAFTAATGDVVYRSTSSGSVWNPETTGSGVQMNDVHFANDQNGWAVGENGSIYVTSNAGESWTPQSTGSASLQSIFFIDANNGWIAGTGGAVYYTTNGGSPWLTPSSGVPAVDLYDIHFVNTTTGWAVGANGTIIKTTDGGVNWAAQTSGTTNQLNGVYFVNANTGYAAGANDTILKTTDGGTTWIPQTSPSLGNNFNDIYFTDSNTGYICGDGGAILSTIDGGAGAAGNQVVMHPTASTATDQFTLIGCASSFDCVNDQPGNAATGYALAVDNDGAFYLDGGPGNTVLFDLDDS
ncbi:MAG: hypothetical protein JSV21_03640, partial [Nitrospirota bacterium]